MNRRLLVSVICLGTAAVSPTAAVAQHTPQDLGGFRALLFTPAGALPTVILVKSVRDSARRGWIAAGYLQYKERGAVARNTNYGVSAQLKVWRGISVGGTYGYHTCNSGCAGFNMGGVDVTGVLLHRSAKLPDEADSEIGWQLSAGYGKDSKVDESATSYTALLPMTVTLPQAYDGRLTLSLVPSLAYGTLHDGVGTLGTPGDYGSLRAIIGAGVGYLFSAGLGLHITVHRIAVEESATQTGLLASWRF